MKKLIVMSLIIWVMSLYIGIIHIDFDFIFGDFNYNGKIWLERPWYSVIFFAGYFVAILLETKLIKSNEIK